MIGLWLSRRFPKLANRVRKPFKIFSLVFFLLIAVTIEVGIQNSALGLVLVFNFFEGLGGMAIITAWWGIWHIIAGLLVAAFFSHRPLTR